MAISLISANSPKELTVLHKLVLSLILSITLLGLAGCNTLRGVGQDVQKAGAVLEDAAKKK
jgi:entericidin A